MEPTARYETIETAKASLSSSATVGREAPLDALRDRLDKAANGQGRVILLGGDAGIGKSRLVRDLKQVAATRELRIIEGRCSSTESSVPYAPLMDALVTRQHDWIEKQRPVVAHRLHRHQIEHPPLAGKLEPQAVGQQDEWPCGHVERPRAFYKLVEGPTKRGAECLRAGVSRPSGARVQRLAVDQHTRDDVDAQTARGPTPLSTTDPPGPTTPAALASTVAEASNRRRATRRFGMLQIDPPERMGTASHTRPY